MKRSLILSYLLLAFVSLSMAQSKLEAELDSAKILIGQRAYLKISVEADKKAKISFPEYKIQQEITPGVEVLNIRKDTTNTDGKRLLIATYILTSWDKNTYKIPSQTIIVDGEKLSTKVFTLTVDETKVDKSKGVQKPADGIMEVPFAWIDLLPAVGWLILALVLIVVAMLLRKRMKANKSLSLTKKMQRKLTPYEEAMEAVMALKKKATENTDQKEYYTSVTVVLRRYLEKRFGIHAMESTSEEILEQLREKTSERESDELRNLFETADLVKFAKYQTAEADKEYYLSNMATFIEKTKEIISDENLEKERQRERERQIANSKSKIAMKIVINALIIVAAMLILYVAYDVYQIVM